MPRGRHRHSPPLHRLLPPSAIAGVSLICALGPWVFTELTVLRGLAAAAAATAVVGAIVMRRWDTQAGKRVADLTRARASDEWRFEERVAELEADLEESRELRVKLEQRLRAKRTELAGLRNEHAALLRRYATAETERASALEERRVLEIEAATPVRALVAGPSGASAVAAAAAAESKAIEAAPAAETAGSEGGEEKAEAAVPALFSPAGSQLFLRAKAALARFDGDGDGSGDGDRAPKGEPAAKVAAVKDAAGMAGKTVAVTAGAPESDGESGGAGTEVTQEDEAQGQPGAADGHEHAAATTSTTATAAAQPAQQPTGHFTVPTAVAVVPTTTPVRRRVTEGGFDFFGTKKGMSGSALEAVQNEDLADVVGQEALALHKAETEAQFKPADDDSRGTGQVIDLTAHDETEQIDVQGLRSAAS